MYFTYVLFDLMLFLFEDSLGDGIHHLQIGAVSAGSQRECLGLHAGGRGCRALLVHLVALEKAIEFQVLSRHNQPHLDRIRNYNSAMARRLPAGLRVGNTG